MVNISQSDTLHQSMKSSTAGLETCQAIQASLLVSMRLETLGNKEIYTFILYFFRATKLSTISYLLVPDTIISFRESLMPIWFKRYNEQI